MALKDRLIPAKFRKNKVLLPALLVLLAAIGGTGYLALLYPNSVLTRWALAALPSQITMITMGPYPDEAAFERLKKNHVKYIVSLLDPRLPFEKDLIAREQALAAKYGMTVKLFPMASSLDRRAFPDDAVNQKKAVEFLKTLDGPAYVHCYLGKYRVSRVREELAKAGIPKRYWTASAAGQEDYWQTVARLDEAWKEYNAKNYARALEILAPLNRKDSEVANLRGWAHYRLGLIDSAAEDFQQGLENEPNNARNLIGKGYCYLRKEEPIMAQRQFAAVMEQNPDDQGALTGMGLAHLRLGNKAAAADLFAKVLAKDPGDEEAKEYLALAKTP
ncbi:MAG: tetratricopeptide repeat protein [Terriglobia bacterium]